MKPSRPTFIADREDALKRLWKYTIVNPESGCWEWHGKRNENGYGQLWSKDGERVAHRYSYSIFFGEFDLKWLVLHNCDNPCCVNPDHLRLGTQSDNLLEAVRKGRKTQFGETNPAAKLTREAVLIIRNDALGRDAEELATAFNVTPEHVKSVQKRRRWGHI